MATLDSKLFQDIDGVRDCLQQGANVNAKDDDSNGCTALIWASQWGNLDVVRELLDHDGIDVNFKSDSGNTALISASEGGHLDVVCALLNHDGIDVNIQNEDGETALMWASFCGHLDEVRADRKSVV